VPRATSTIRDGPTHPCRAARAREARQTNTMCREASLARAGALPAPHPGGGRADPWHDFWRAALAVPVPKHSRLPCGLDESDRIIEALDDSTGKDSRISCFLARRNSRPALGRTRWACCRRGIQRWCRALQQSVPLLRCAVRAAGAWPCHGPLCQAESPARRRAPLEKLKVAVHRLGQAFGIGSRFAVSCCFARPRCSRIVSVLEDSVGARRWQPVALVSHGGGRRRDDSAV
jgi:hypothetical protein